MPRVIRKLDLVGRTTFDEQLWPINALLVVLCALVAGVIIGASQFNGELSWQNGWLRLATLVGSVGLLMVLAWWFQGQLGRRFQLGAAASLLLHVVVGILLYWQQLDLLADNRPTARRESVPVLVQYEYHVRSPDELTPQEAHERPVDTPTPEDRPIEVSRTAPQELQIEEPRPQPLPETTPSVQPTEVTMQRNEFAAPRRADRESLLSRSTTQLPAQPSQQISAPEQRAAVEPSRQSLDAAATSIARREPTPAAQSADVETPPTVELSPDVSQPARRALEAPAQPAPSMTPAAIARAVATPAEAASTAEAPAVALSAQSQDQPELRASATAAQRESISSPAQRDISAADPARQPSAIAATPSNSPTTTTGATPSVNSPTGPAASRAIAQAAATATSAADQPASATTSNPASEPTGPAQSETSRLASADQAGSPGATSALDFTAAGISQAPAARRENSLTPGLSSAAQTTSAPARSVAVGASAASPLNLENPALAAASSPAETPGQQPAATSFSRSTSGATGVGQSPNFDRGLPARATQATVASAASQRAASSIDVGAAPAASAPAILPRARADAAINSTTALAQDAAPADYRGGQAPMQLEATSGAAVTRTASAAPQGAIAADAGNLPADTGAPEVVSRKGLSRSDGGGQPTVAAVVNQGQPGRSTAPGDVVSAIASNVVAPSAIAPASAASMGTKLAAESASASRTAPSASVTGPTRELAAPAPAGSAAIAAAAGAPARALTGAPMASNTQASAPARSQAATPAGDTQADNVQLAAAPQSPGANETRPLESSLTGAARDGNESSGRATPAPIGSLAAGTAINSPARATAAAVAGRRPSRDDGVAGPEVNDATAGGPLARSTAAAPTTAGEALDVPELAGSAPAGAANASGDAQPGPSTGPNAVERRASGGLPVQVASVAGPGGLASELSAVVGSRKISAQRESDLIHDTDTRFLGREIAGAIPAPSFVRDAAKGFERRGRDNGAGQGQQGSKTEEAIERGLEFLARSQQADGSWSFQKFAGATDDDIGSIHSDAAATGLALMSFLGGGYDHFEDKHRDTVRRGIQYLLRQQSETGDLYVAQDPKSHESAWLYSHAIASIALCEALGMTGDPELRGPAQSAIEFIENAQDRQFGGWRYEPGVGSDTSVAGWQLMALKSGELAGLKVKRDTYEAARKWLDRAQVRGDGSQYVYNPIVPNTQYQTDQRRPTMTSVGLLMRLYLGWDRNRPELRRGADQILKYPPANGTSSNPMRDTYYWYYATQVMFHMRGDYWRQWNERLHSLLVGGQTRQGPHAGSWDPNGDVPDRWGPHGGRIYVTTLNLLSLEVYYRHLPIYEETAK